MALTLSQTGIETSNTVEAWHVTQSIDAFTGTEAYDITLSGSFNMTGSINAEGEDHVIIGTNSITLTGSGVNVFGASAISIDSPSISIANNASPTTIALQTFFTDGSIIASNTGTEINFSDAGNGSTGFFRIPIAQTSNGSPRAGMMYWDDNSGTLYIYSENTSTWMSASFA